MKKTIIGVVATTVVLYVWGFLFWGINTIPYESMKQTADVAGAQAMLREYFPESGVYMIPGMITDPAELEARYQAGPTGMLHIQHGSRTPMDLTIMIGGFVLNLVFVALLAVFFKTAKATEFRDFARLSLITGVTAVVLIDVGDMIWWQETIGWKIWPLVYNFTAFLIAGHLLGVFMKAQPGKGTTAT